MAIREEATRRNLEAEFQRGFSPPGGRDALVGFRRLRVPVEGYEAVRIPTAGLNWSGAMKYHRAIAAASPGTRPGTAPWRGGAS